MSQKLLLYLTFVIFVSGLVLTDTTIAQPANLYARWPLNEGEGEMVFDISGNDLHGMIQNADNGLGLDGSVWVEDPVRGTVISFNGTADGAFVRAGDIPQMTLTNDFTWSFWAKHSADNTADNDIILGNRMDENAVDFVPRQFIKFTPTKFEWHMNGNGNDNLDYDDIPADIWLHHAIVKAGGQLTYYRNGVESGSETFTQPLDVPQPLFFGGDNEGSAGENWSGLMSEVQLYTRALTADEVLQVMALPVGTVIRTSAYGEIPSNKAIDVSIDTNLSWAQDDYSDTHDVYFSTVFEDVNDADRT
ncbi:MAG: LamG domain-containing protein, partial [Planctomycetes bacterium]|nr:LamG domain-containing protein [Planctomycetota bacterium]